MKETSLRLVNLVTGYVTRRGQKIIGENLNAEMEPGQLICLLGPNGAGKSTLLKTLSGFLAPLGGTVLLQGRNLMEYSDRELSRSIGVVLTERLTVSSMKVKELVSLGRSPYTGFWGRLADDDWKVVEDAIRMVGIDNLTERMVGTLSDGERQKAMIAKALAQQTPVIFLDEPTAFLDYPSKVEVMRLLHTLSRNEGKTIFMSTHDLELALQIADRAWLLDKQHGLVTGVPEDLALSGELARYFERPGIHFDSVSGLFKVVDDICNSVRLTGNGIRAVMAKKALRRNGIAVDNNSSGLLSIVVDDDVFYLDGRSFYSIAELIDSVNSKFNS